MRRNPQFCVNRTKTETLTTSFCHLADSSADHAYEDDHSETKTVKLMLPNIDQLWSRTFLLTRWNKGLFINNVRIKGREYISYYLSCCYKKRLWACVNIINDNPVFFIESKKKKRINLELLLVDVQKINCCIGWQTLLLSRTVCKEALP